MMMKTIRFKILLLIVGGLSIGAIGLVLYFNRIYERNADRLTKESIRSASMAFVEVDRTSTELMTAAISAVMRDPEVKAGIMARDPARLLALSQPLYRDWRGRFGITHWNYWEPEQSGDMNAKGLRNVLRVGTPDMHGDFVERVTLARVAREHRLVSGLDLGFTGLVQRVLVPVEDGGRTIGYLELGREIGGALGQMKKVSGDEYGLLLTKARMDEKKWATQRTTAGLRNNWADMPGLLLANNTSDDDAIFQYSGNIADVPDEGLPLQIVSKGDKTLARGVFPIHDVSGAKVGAIFVLHDITSVYEDMRSGQRQAVLGVAVLMVVLAALFALVFQFLIVRRLQRMIQVATRVVGGEFDLEIVPSAEDEIGSFETLFEQFRMLFVELIGQTQQRATGTTGRDARGVR
jgi:HAMP domain-containing protein